VSSCRPGVAAGSTYVRRGQQLVAARAGSPSPKLGPRPTDADRHRDAWADLEHLWPQTIARASALPPALLHERVNGEWSFIKTLRHLLFVTTRGEAGRCSALRRRTTHSTSHLPG
jgi:hypothetical protein